MQVPASGIGSLAVEVDWGSHVEVTAQQVCGLRCICRPAGQARHPRHCSGSGLLCAVTVFLLGLALQHAEIDTARARRAGGMLCAASLDLIFKTIK